MGNYKIENIFRSEEKVKSIQTWLKTLPIHNIERRVCGSMLLEPEVIAEIEKTLDQMQESPKNITMNIKPHLLFKVRVLINRVFFLFSLTVTMLSGAIQKFIYVYCSLKSKWATYLRIFWPKPKCLIALLM
jgi:hypothetical protein